MSLTWDPSTWALASGCLHIFRLILLYVSQHRSLTDKRRLTLTNLVSSKDKYRPKSSIQTYLFNIWTGTSGQPQVKLILLPNISTTVQCGVKHSSNSYRVLVADVLGQLGKMGLTASTLPEILWGHRTRIFSPGEMGFSVRGGGRWRRGEGEIPVYVLHCKRRVICYSIVWRRD